MGDAIPSDHDAVDSHRVALEPVGRTRRSQLPLPKAVTCAVGDIVSLSVGGEQLYANVESTLTDEPIIRGAFENRGLARSDDGEDRLGAWLDANGFGPGTTLVLDVITEGYAYGVREPGSRVVYEATAKPNTSLTDIAESVEES